MKHCFVLTGDVLSLVLNNNAFDELQNEMIRQKLIKNGKKIADQNMSDYNKTKLKFIKTV